MDEQGVRVTTNGQVRLYEWADLFDAQQVIIGHGRVGPLYAVQLRRKGQLPIADNRTDLIQDDFGLGHDQIIAAIQAGIHRWGNGPAVASA